MIVRTSYTFGARLVAGQEVSPGVGSDGDEADGDAVAATAARASRQAAQDDALQKEAVEEFGQLFSLRKPKDAASGLGSGLKNVAKGVAAGAVSLVAAPVVGAAQGGVAGGLKGAGAGILGAVILPVAGVATGVAQVVRGVANTPEAIRSRGQGATWDETTRTWVEKESSERGLATFDPELRRQGLEREARNAKASGGWGAGWKLGFGSAKTVEEGDKGQGKSDAAPAVHVSPLASGVGAGAAAGSGGRGGSSGAEGSRAATKGEAHEGGVGKATEDANAAETAKAAKATGPSSSSPRAAPGAASASASASASAPAAASGSSASAPPRPPPSGSRAHASGAASAPDFSSSDPYALLGVSRDATAAEIRKAYFALARTAHPDKHPDDPQAADRFQRLSQAYQILSDPSKRARYDAGEDDPAAGGDFADGAEMFAALFGAERFEHLVGELILAGAMREDPDALSADDEGGVSVNAGRVGGKDASDSLEKRQAERVAHLADNLKALLRRHVEGDVGGFRTAMQHEAVELAATSYGDVMLRTIGRAYDQASSAQLGGVFAGTWAATRAKAHALKSQIDAMGIALRVQKAQQDALRLAARESDALDAAAKAREWVVKQEELEKAAAAPAATLSSPAPSASGAAPPPAPSPESRAARAAAPFIESAIKAAREAGVQRVALEEATLPLILDAMWAANQLDVQATLRAVTKRVLREEGVDAGVLRARAVALKELGAIFKAAAQAAGSDERVAAARKARQAGGSSEARKKAATEAKERIEAAMQAVVEKRVHEEEERMHKEDVQ